MVQESITELLESFHPGRRDFGRRLTEMLENDPGEVQRALVDYLSREGHRPGEQFVIWVLREQDRIVPLLLDTELCSLERALRLARIVKRHVDQIDVLLARHLKHARGETAVRILRLLAETAENNRTLPLLSRVLREESPQLRSKAARVFAQHCQNTLFTENALKDPEPSVRASAIEGLGLSARPFDRKVLELARSDSDPAVKAHALLAFYRQGDPRAPDLLRSMLESPGAPLREWAAWAMGETGDDQFVDDLEALQADPAAAVRDSAAKAAVRLKEAAVEEAEEPSIEEDLAARYWEELAGDAGRAAVHVPLAHVDSTGLRSIQFVVARHEGAYLDTLAPEHVSVHENGVAIPEAAAVTPRDRGPLALAYVLDCSGSMSALKVREMNAAVLRSLEGKAPEDRVAIYKYSMDVERAAGLSGDLRHLDAAIRRKHAGLKTASRLHDAISKALDDLAAEKGCRAVVAIADGADRGSEHSLPSLVRKSRRHGIALHVAAFDAGSELQQLSELAKLAGGLFYPAEDARALGSACRQLVSWLKNFYAVSYRSSRQPGRVQIQVRTPAFDAETSVEAVPLVYDAPAGGGTG